MFRLIMTRDDGAEFALFLDPHRSLLLDERGERVSLEPLGASYDDTASFCAAPVTAPGLPGPKSRKVERLRIQLGLQCNYSCAYCMQAADRAGDARQSSGSVTDFLAGLDQWLEGAPGEIEFWGGEPFVYWRKLQPLAEALRQRFPDAVLRVITNGSLLDADKVAWLNRLGFVVAVSHDGPGQHLRGPDPFDDPERGEAIRRLFRTLGPSRVSFLSVLTLQHHSPAALVAFFISRTGQTDVAVSIEGMVTVHDAKDVLFSPLTEDDHRRVRRHLYDEFRMPAVFHRTLVLLPQQALLRQFATGMPSFARGQNCGMDRPGHFAVALDGTALVCHNANQDRAIGSVHDFDAIALAHSTSWHSRPECHACPVLATCAGSCMLVEGPERRQSCDNAFTLGTARLALFLNLLTGAKLTRIEGDIIRFPSISTFNF